MKYFFNLNKLLFLIMLFCFTVNTFALTYKEAIDNVRTEFKNAKTLQADFRQTIYNTSLKNKQEIFGIIKVKKPDKLTMTYDKPENMRQKIVITKGIFQLYIEDSNQLIKRTITDTEMELEKQIFPWLDDVENYNINLEVEKNKTIKLNITPTENSFEKFKKFIVYINPEKWTVFHTHMIDLSNNEVDYFFNNIIFNKDIDEKYFKFTLPEDVDIIEN